MNDQTIVVLGSFNANNGITTFVKRNYQRLTGLGWSFRFINIANAKPARDLKQIGNYTEIKQLKKGPFQHFTELKRALKLNLKYSKTIHLHLDSLHNFLPIMLAKHIGYRRIIIHSHSDQRGQYGKLKKLAHHLGMKVAAHDGTDFIACSQYAADFFYSRKLQTQSNFKFIYNGILLKKYLYMSTAAQRFRKKYGISENSIVIGHCGRFSRQKNHQFLLAAYNQFHQQHPDSFLVLIGDGENLEEIKRQTAAYKLTDNVIFTGYVENVAEMQNAFDIFAFPSLYEGLSLSLLENLANGTQAIVSKNQSPELFEMKNVHPLEITSTVAVQNWANQMKELSKKKQNKKVESSRAVAYLSKKGFTLERTTAALLDLYSSEKESK
ncbi:glycosyltransferase [Liquorilactobacillus nagelii]|jgi:glycosyltransferase involved in cell wall biosynthesis|uniref:glycosyltransferase n=1 Tax=Liquorilactobacillus nagelii TaxID=82688 RepID=UPI001CCFBB3F|nr:glycosyltransferase [Liquorilactobacillus nagelii]ULQ48879.1 glycosyltransferase [Liquorilactobacillus nagelii]